MRRTNQFLFEAQLDWLEGTRGILTSHDVRDTLEVATPRAFKGENDGLWSPEHLLLCSVSSCFMTTYLFYAKQKELPVLHFECEATGQVEITGGKLEYTFINIYPVIKVGEEWIETAKQVMCLTEHNCLIAKALKTKIFYHGIVETGNNNSAEKKSVML